VTLQAPGAGAYVLLGDRGGVARRLAELIIEAGGQAEIAPEKLWSDPVAFGRWLGDIKTQSAVKGLINLGPIDDPLMPGDATLATWQQRSKRDVQSFFPLLQMGADDLQRGGTVIAASAMGGLFARGRPVQKGSEPWPIAGGNIGLLKSLSFEWPGCHVKAVDLDPSEDADKQAVHLFRELFLGCGRREVGYPGGQRTIFRTEPAFLREAVNKDREPNGNWVVLGIGGALGITAEALRDVAKAGAKLVLVGRSNLPSPEPPEIAALGDSAALRGHFIAAAKSANERITPREIESKVTRVLRAREMRSNLADLSRLGAEVDYRSVDMCHPAQVKALVDDLYARYGRIDAVYFGIGLIEDQLLINKKPESVGRVIATKTDSAFLLSELLRPDSLKFFGFFTSVAGRYGNRGQSDYAAANEILNQFAWILQRRWGDTVKVAAINWGPWAGTTNGSGMVTPEVREQFTARGVSLVEPDEGREFITRELMYAPTNEVESVAGNNPWEYSEASHKPLPSSPDTHKPADSFPLVCTGNINSKSATSVVIRKRLDLVTDPYLDHHRIDGVPVLPFVAAAEHIAEAASLLDSDLVVSELRDVHMLSGISVGQTPLELEIRVKRDGDQVAGECWIMGSKPRLAYRAKVVLAQSAPEAVPAPPIGAEGPSPVKIREAYDDWLFHGPVFQTITALDALNERHVWARAQPSTPQSFYPPAKGAEWIFDPGVLDGALQLVLVRSRHMRDETPLPIRAGRLCRFGSAPLMGPLTILVTFHSPPEASELVFDIWISDASGNVRLEMKDFEALSTKQLNRLGGGWGGQSLREGAL
jgi:NAD(P)-dependent dehydrogenase (short-subunit alcohol dehydrogenase family)